MPKINNENVIVKIYTLSHPTTGEVRYIGRTTNTLNARLNGHISKAKTNTRKTHKDNWILSLKGVRPTVLEIESIQGWSESYVREQAIIREYLEKGFSLVNSHDRGEGEMLRNISKEQRIKISKTLKEGYASGRIKSPSKKEVVVYDLQGDLISKFDSYKECAEWLGISQKHIEISLKRNCKRLHNYQVRRVEDTPPSKYCIKRDNSFNLKDIYLVDVHSGEVIAFNSYKECKKFLGVSGGSFIGHYLNKDLIFRNKYKITDKNE